MPRGPVPGRSDLSEQALNLRWTVAGFVLATGFPANRKKQEHMSSITVLGAGAMGSGLTRPLIESGWDVRLWGTWLDDHLIDAIEAGTPHPRIDVVISDKVKTFRSDQLAQALEGTDVVVMSVSSDGVPGVAKLALPLMKNVKALWMTSKGFSPDPEGNIQLLPDTLRRIASELGVELPPVVAIAGPVKANECGAGMPTATIYGCLDHDVSKDAARSARTDVYAIAATDDEVGVEICAPMKNVYAIALGIADGLQEATGIPHHNLKAAAFAQAVREMSLLGVKLGARPETAFGLPGVGDLEVTGLSGRNKVYGVRIGRGETPTEAFEEMKRLEQTVEGVPATGLAVKLVEQRAADIIDDLPLLATIDAILKGEVEDVKSALSAAVLPARP